MTEEQKTTLHFILGGVHMNGYIQGTIGEKIRDGVIPVAMEEIEKLLSIN